MAADNGQSFICQWTDCVSEFPSELDMGLHVMTNHLNVLKYGFFTLTRGQYTRIGDDNEEEVVQNSQNHTEDVTESMSPRRRKRLRRTSGDVGGIRIPGEGASSTVRRHEDCEEGTSGAPPARKSREEVAPVAQTTPEDTKENLIVLNESVTLATIESVKMSEVAHNLIIRLRNPPPGHHRLFQSDHFCIICQKNWTTPCPKRHKDEDLLLLSEWRRLFGHLKPTKKLLVGQLRQIMEKYLKQERLIPKVEEVEEEETEQREESEDVHVQEATGNTTDGAEEEEEEGVPVVPIQSSPPEEEVPREREERSEDVTEPLETVPEVSRQSIRSANVKMSKMCTALLFRLQMRSSRLRSLDRTHFCLHCLVFKECGKQHTPPERRLEKTWRKYYGSERISVESLIDQLETLRERYQALEARN